MDNKNILVPNQIPNYPLPVILMDSQEGTYGIMEVAENVVELLEALIELKEQ